jgi:MraZ protein
MPEPAVIVPSFQGRFVYGVDAGRRVMFPSVWRPKNRNVVFMAIAWPIAVEDFLLVLPPDRWQAFMDKIKTGKLTDARAAKLERTIAATSARLALDKAWRFSLPEELASAVGISKEAQFVGRLHQFEIWSPQRYQSAVSVDKEEAAQVAMELGI